MDNINLDKQQLTEVVPSKDNIPDELPSLHIEAKFRISDPESGEVLVEGRS